MLVWISMWCNTCRWCRGERIPIDGETAGGLNFPEDVRRGQLNGEYKRTLKIINNPITYSVTLTKY